MEDDFDENFLGMVLCAFILVLVMAHICFS